MSVVVGRRTAFCRNVYAVRVRWRATQNRQRHLAAQNHYGRSVLAAWRRHGFRHPRIGVDPEQPDREVARNVVLILCVSRAERTHPREKALFMVIDERWIAEPDGKPPKRRNLGPGRMTVRKGKELPGWAGHERRKRSRFAESRKFREAEVRSKRALHHVEREHVEGEAELPVTRSLGKTAVRSDDSFRLRKRLDDVREMNGTEVFFKIGQRGGCGDYAGGTDLHPVVAQPRPGWMRRCRTERLVAKRTRRKGADLRLQRIIEPVIGDGNANRHLGDVQEVPGVPVRKRGNRLYFAFGPAHIASVARQAIRHRQRRKPRKCLAGRTEKTVSAHRAFNRFRGKIHLCICNDAIGGRFHKRVGFRVLPKACEVRICREKTRMRARCSRLYRPFRRRPPLLQLRGILWPPQLQPMRIVRAEEETLCVDIRRIAAHTFVRRHRQDAPLHLDGACNRLGVAGVVSRHICDAQKRRKRDFDAAHRILFISNFSPDRARRANSPQYGVGS